MGSQKNAQKRKLIGLNIALHRKEKGLTQEQLAEAVGKSLSYISQIEANSKGANPTLDTLIDISESLDVDLHRLLNIEYLLSALKELNE